MIKHIVTMPDGREVKWEEEEEATLQLRGSVKVTAKRTQYTAEAFQRRAHYGERRDVRDGAPSREYCKEQGLDCDAEALKFGNSILQGYYTGDIVERTSMDPEVKYFRDSVYAVLKEHGLSEQKIGALGSSKASIMEAGVKAGIAASSMNELWQSAEEMAELLKASRKIKVKLILNK